MAEEFEIRTTNPDDMAALERLYPRAFPDEDLLALVSDLLDSKPSVLSLAAIDKGALVGHIIFTHCGVSEADSHVALLGPLAVIPDRQRQGIGSKLIHDGLARLKTNQTVLVCVLGDPGYYSRSGFTEETNVRPPYPLPDEWDGAWQSVNLHNTRQPLHGTLCVPRPWRTKALWQP